MNCAGPCAATHSFLFAWPNFGREVCCCYPGARTEKMGSMSLASSPKNKARRQQAHAWEKRAKSCHRIRGAKRSKGRDFSKVVKQGKASTGKDLRSHLERQAKQVHQCQECNQGVGEMQPLQSRRAADVKCKNKQTYETRQHSEPN